MENLTFLLLDGHIEDVANFVDCIGQVMELSLWQLRCRADSMVLSVAVRNQLADAFNLAMLAYVFVEEFVVR